MLFPIQEDEVLKYVDTVMERLMDSIVELGMENCVNIMVVADHGMANRTCDNVYILDDVRKSISTLTLLFHKSHFVLTTFILISALE